MACDRLTTRGMEVGEKKDDKNRKRAMADVPTTASTSKFNQGLLTERQPSFGAGIVLKYMHLTGLEFNSLGKTVATREEKKNVC